MTTSDVLRRPDGSLRPVPVNRPAPPPAAAVQPRQSFPAVQPPYPPAVQPGADPDATVVIGRHRQGDPPTVRRRRGWVGRAAVKLFRRGGAQ